MRKSWLAVLLIAIAAWPLVAIAWDITKPMQYWPVVSVYKMNVGTCAWLVHQEDARMTSITEPYRVSGNAKVQLRKPACQPWEESWLIQVEKISSSEVVVHYQAYGTWNKARGIIKP